MVHIENIFVTHTKVGNFVTIKENMTFKTENQKDKILITGSTGNVGFEVVKSALKIGLHIVVGIREEKDALKFSGLDVETRIIDFEKPETFPLAIDGISRIFLLRPPALSNVKKYIFPFLALAKDTGIKQIVLLSLLGADKNLITPHRKIEKEIMSLHIPYTFLRPSFFMQNLSTTHRAEIKNEQAICLPAGKGKTSFVDIRDIAEVAALSFTGNQFLNQSYSLTGGEALNYYEVADIFSKVLGTKIVYRNLSLISFYYRLKHQGFPFGQRIIMSAIYLTAKLGLAGRVTTDVDNLLKRKPTSMEQFVRDNKNIWIS